MMLRIIDEVNGTDQRVILGKVKADELIEGLTWASHRAYGD